jgi:5-methylcytosine-specific restriction endonuclease McrBC regulatory subunit McrC
LEEVELDTSIGPSDCYRLRLDRLSLHYEKALEISKTILEESFVRSTEKGRSKGFNFIVDMNRLFEDFLTEMTRQIMSEKCPRLQVIDQMGFNSLDRDGKLTIKPDLLIFNQMSGKFPIIIDAKYKLDVKNPDVYQMIAYSLAIPDSKVACLLYPDSEGNYDMRFDIRRDLFGYENDYLPLLIRTINLSAKTEESYYAFVQRVKNELWSILVELMDIAGLINNLLKGAQKGSIAEKT